MAVSDVQAVLEFLQKNGFSEAESALKHDMIEKGDVGSLAYEKFFFPMVPPPPPVKIPASSSHRSDIPVLSHFSRSSSNSSSNDEFVSVGSSTSDRCSSEFTNPYGIQSATPSSSKASSEKLSQFGTARDYPDFDVQNDLFWYDEKDDGNFMTPSFEGPDFFGCPTEDKFIMISDEDRQHENPNNIPQELQPEIRASYLNKTSSLNVAPALNNDVREVPLMNSHHLERTNEFDECLKGDSGASAHYDFSVPLCDYSHPSTESLIEYGDLHDVGGVHDTNVESSPHKELKSSNNSAKRLSKYEWNEDFESSSDVYKKIPEKDLTLNDINKFEVVRGGHKDLGHPNQTDVTRDDDADDDILMYNNQEDDLEVFELRIIHRKNRTGFEENKDLPIVLNTVIAGRYYITEYLGSAAFSKVVQAHDLFTGVDVCLKIIKNDKDFFDQSLDEIKLLKLVNKYDPNDEHHILRLYDYFYHQEHLFIVCELLRANLYEFQKFNQESGGEAYFTIKRLQVITRQCLEALDYLHNLGILHCDLKPENILIKNYKRCEIKVIDLGSSCFLTDNLCLYVQSRSYRAPEVILGLPYDQKIDIWSLGCILAELCSGEVLFPNHAIVMILARIIGMFGPLDLNMLERGQETNKYFTEAFDLYYINEETNQLEYVIPEESSLENQLQVSDRGFINFIRDLLEINPQRRPTAKVALQHPWLSKLYK